MEVKLFSDTPASNVSKTVDCDAGKVVVRILKRDVGFGNVGSIGIMRVGLLLHISQHEIGPNALVWISLARHQLELAEAAMKLHDQHMKDAGINATTLHAKGMHSEHSDGMFMKSMLAKHQPKDIADVEMMMLEAALPARLAEIGARAFVYEIAVFRLALKQAVKVAPHPDKAADILRTFDNHLPGLVPVRDTLAHLDERMAGTARKSNFVPELAEAAGHPLELGILVDRDRIAAHTADGSFQSVPVTMTSLIYAMSVAWEFISLFPRRKADDPAVEPQQS